MAHKHEKIVFGGEELINPPMFGTIAGRGGLASPVGLTQKVAALLGCPGNICTCAIHKVPTSQAHGLSDCGQAGG